MGCRAQFWTLIGALSLLWICGGIYGTFSQPGTESARSSGITTFLCTGIPVLLVSSVLANGARQQWQEKRRHDELMATQQNQAAALQQMAAVQTAQAQMQMMQMQQAQAAAAPKPALSAGADIKAQMEAAKALIQAKQYKQARSLLMTINHDRAREWITKLDAMKV